MNEKTLLLGLLKKSFKKSDEEVAELLYEKSDDGTETLKGEALNSVIDLFEKKISGIKEKFEIDENRLKEEGRKSAMKNLLSQFENEVKEKYSIDSEKEGLELIDDIIDKFKGSSELDPDKIKLSQVYRDREKELMKQIKDQKKEFETSLENFKVEQSKKEVWKVAEKYISKKLAELNPAFPKNPKAAENLRNLFINSFAEFEFQMNGDETPLPMKEGKRVEDKLGNEVPFDSLIADRINEYFDIPVQNPKGGAGNESVKPKLDGVPTSFKDNDEYVAYQTKEPDPQKRIAAKEIFKQQQKK